MKLHLFFNYSANDAVPKHDYWINFKNPDSTKLAFFCAESWRRHGWDVERISTAGLKGFEPFTGQLRESQQLYALEFFNFWFKARELAPAWFGTTDVFNYGFTPDQARQLQEEAHRRDRCAVTLQAAHFSASLLWVTKHFCDEAIKLIRAYDAGEFPKLTPDLVSDETVLREYAKHLYFHPPDPGPYPLTRYAMVEPNWEIAPLIHCPRSVLQWFK